VNSPFEIALPIRIGNPRELVEWVTAGLRAIGSVVDDIDDADTPTMELLEAGDAVRFAVVRLSDWSSGEGVQ
jgi:hypothetical protein